MQNYLQWWHLRSGKQEALCCCSITKSHLTLHNPMECSTPGSSVLLYLQSLLKFTSIELVMLSNHLILCHPLLYLLSIFPNMWSFPTSWLFHIKWPKYWSFSISFSNVSVLHSICQQIWKTQQWSQDWKKSVFNPIPKKVNAKECSNYCTVVLISRASKIMLKIL